MQSAGDLLGGDRIKARQRLIQHKRLRVFRDGDHKSGRLAHPFGGASDTLARCSFGQSRRGQGRDRLALGGRGPPARSAKNCKVSTPVKLG